MATMDVETAIGDWCQSIAQKGDDLAGHFGHLCDLPYYPFLFKNIKKRSKNFNRPHNNYAKVDLHKLVALNVYLPHSIV